jgi:FkbM family methyltransferase
MDLLNTFKKLLWHNLIARNSGVDWEIIRSIVDTANHSKKIQGVTELARMLDGNASLSFSQTGEDMALKSFFRDQAQGFFVDVGAHHPTRFSNTFYFYLMGWNGINIDPTPGIMSLFEEIRPNDTNLEVAIGSEGISHYYQFKEGAYNTFDEDIASDLIKKQISPLLAKHEIRKIPLKDILLQHLPPGKKIDLLSIDAEGLDLEILESNDWSRFRPRYVCAECHTTDPSRAINPGSLLKDQGYSLIASTEFSSIYKNSL